MNSLIVFCCISTTFIIVYFILEMYIITIFIINKIKISIKKYVKFLNVFTKINFIKIEVLLLFESNFKYTLMIYLIWVFTYSTFII